MDPLREHVPPRPAVASDVRAVEFEPRSRDFPPSESEPRAPQKQRRRSNNDNKDTFKHSRHIQALDGKLSGSHR